MAIGPQNQRDQGMVAIAIIAVLLIGAYWYFVFDPQATTINTLAAHVDSLDEANAKAKAQLAKGTTAELKAQAAMYRENLNLMRTLVPVSNEVPSLLEQVSTAARRAKLDVGGVEPEPLIVGDYFDTDRYKVKMTGSFHEIGEVLSNVGSLNRIVSPMNLSLILAAQSNSQRATAGRQPLTATFEIQTYVVRTKPPKKKAPKKKAGEAPATEGGL